MIRSDRNPARYAIWIETITRYLLNPGHPRDGSKARFFLAFDFSADRPAEPMDALA